MATKIFDENNAKEIEPLKILRNVPIENGFHFTTNKGEYNGLTAISLEDFISKIKIVDIESISFHYYRGDFQRWITTTLGDKDFANQLCFIETQISGEQLRKQLLKMLDKRLRELKGLNWIETKGI